VVVRGTGDEARGERRMVRLSARGEQVQGPVRASGCLTRWAAYSVLGYLSR